MRIIAAAKYVSPRSRPLNAEEQEVTRISYALKIPTAEAVEIAAAVLAPLLEASEKWPTTNFVLMPVPSSTGSVDANRTLANAIANAVNENTPRTRAFVKVTVGRQHPVESSCSRHRAGLPPLAVEDHAMVRIAGPLSSFDTAYFFVDNVTTGGVTLEACRQALGFGDAIVWADAQRAPARMVREEADAWSPGAPLAVTGNTYPVRRELRALGGVWDDIEQAWRFADGATAAKARALVEKAPKQTAPTPKGRRARYWERQHRFNRRTDCSAEDAICGAAAYEDACARACGL